MCPKCKQPLVAHTRLCWACGEDHLLPEGRNTIEVQQLDPSQADEVVKVLAALVDEPGAAVASVVKEPPFELSSATPPHLNQVAQLLSSRGAVLRVSTLAAPSSGWRFRLRLNRVAGAKFLAVAALGAAAYGLALPGVYWTALAMAGLMLFAEVDLRPKALEIDPLKGGDQLDPLDSQLTQDLVRTRSGLTDAEVIAGMGCFLSEYVSVATILRANGDHLTTSGAKTSDQRLRQLLRQALLMAAEGQRCSQAEEKAVSLAPDRASTVRKLRADVLRQLDRLTAGLKDAQAQTVGLSRNKLLTVLDTSITALHTLVGRLKAEARSW